MKDMMGLMKQAQAMQAKMAETRLADTTDHVVPASTCQPRSRRRR